jgi:hypothetical protein
MSPQAVYCLENVYRAFKEVVPKQEPVRVRLRTYFGSAKGHMGVTARKSAEVGVRKFCNRTLISKILARLEGVKYI